MTLWQIVLIVLAAFALLFVIAAATALLIKRRLSRLARFAPECEVLCRRLAEDPRVPRLPTFALRALAGYLALPLDLIPDFIPIIGRLDDALVVAIAIRVVLRSVDADLVRQHWPGADPPPAAILRGAPRRLERQSVSNA
jgi:uncharacterized membrane protein YkvA (DUF1232 family)